MTQPLPVRLRSCTAARMPITDHMPVETSLIAGAQNVGGSSGLPVSVITAP